MEKKSILLVEDDAVVRDMTSGVLKMHYNVLEASRCSEAREQLKNPIDLALIDYKLPDGDGFDVLRTVREGNPALPAIIMTAYSHEMLAIKAVRAGVTDYIKKPLSIMYLMKRLSDIFGAQGGSDSEPEHVGTRENFIMDFIGIHIEENYMKRLTRKTVEAMAHMDRNKFCAMFKERFGQTFTSHLNTIRVKNAAELLIDSGLRVTEIAHAVGYESVTHFERVFKEECGLSPREYRNRLKRQDEETSLQS